MRFFRRNPPRYVRFFQKIKVRLLETRKNVRWNWELLLHWEHLCKIVKICTILDCNCLFTDQFIKFSALYCLDVIDSSNLFSRTFLKLWKFSTMPHKFCFRTILLEEIILGIFMYERTKIHDNFSKLGLNYTENTRLSLFKLLLFLFWKSNFSARNIQFLWNCIEKY